MGGGLAWGRARLQGWVPSTALRWLRLRQEGLVRSLRGRMSETSRSRAQGGCASRCEGGCPAAAGEMASKARVCQ